MTTVTNVCWAPYIRSPLNLKTTCVLDILWMGNPRLREVSKVSSRLHKWWSRSVRSIPYTVPRFILPKQVCRSSFALCPVCELPSGAYPPIRKQNPNFLASHFETYYMVPVFSLLPKP